MLAEVPAAPEVAPLLLWALALLSLLAYLVARGLLAGWTQTFGRLFEGLADALDVKVFGKRIGAGKYLRSANKAVIRWIGAWAATMDSASGRFFHAGARVQRWVAHEIWAATGATLRLGNWLVWKHIPNVIRAHLKWTVPAYVLYRLIRRAVRVELPHILRTMKSVTVTVERKLVRRIEMPHAPEWEWLHHHWKALRRIVLGTALAGGAAVLPWVHVLPRIRVLERFRVTTRKRLHRLERIFAAAGMAALMANALGLPNWRCITRGNLGKTARRLCGTSPLLLEDLLALFADFLILTNVCTVLPWLEAAVETVGVPIAETLTKVGAGLCDTSVSPAPALNVPALALPANPGVSLAIG